MALDIEKLREVFNAIAPHATQVTGHFYGELFSAHPEAKGFFKEERMPQQQEALAKSLAFIMENLDKPEVLTNYLRRLGARHVDYGTRDEHYGWIAEALLRTLEYFFEDAWTQEHRQNWTEALQLIAGEMIIGARKRGKKVVEMKKSKGSASLPEFIQAVAHEALESAIEDALMSADIQKLVQDKTRAIIQATVEAETKRFIAHLGRKKKAA